jgi:hypothetical protein
VSLLLADVMRRFIRRGVIPHRTLRYFVEGVLVSCTCGKSSLIYSVRKREGRREAEGERQRERERERDLVQ